MHLKVPFGSNLNKLTWDSISKIHLYTLVVVTVVDCRGICLFIDILSSLSFY